VISSEKEKISWSAQQENTQKSLLMLLEEDDDCTEYFSSFSRTVERNYSAKNFYYI